MKTVLASAFALCTMTSAAMAGPVELTDAQMDRMTAGQLVEVSNNNVTVQAAVGAQAIVQACALVDGCTPQATNDNLDVSTPGGNILP